MVDRNPHLPMVERHPPPPMEEHNPQPQINLDGSGDAIPRRWERFLKQRTGIGMCTIIYMHFTTVMPSGDKIRTTFDKGMVVYLLSLVTVAQLMTPALLLIYSVQANAEGSTFCPMSASDTSRALAFAIACMYQFRIAFMVGKKHAEPFVILQAGARSNVCLGLCLWLDSFMTTWYELIIYYVNLLIVLFTPDPLEMVLNALGLEFIQKLDDAAKKQYIAIFAHDTVVDEIFGKYQETFRTTEQGDHPHTYCRILFDSWTIRGVNYILPAFALVYLPLCKSK